MAASPTPSAFAHGLGARLWSNAVLSVVENAVRVAAVFVVSPWIIGGLGVRDYGLWVLVAAWAGWFQLLDLGMANAAARQFSRAVSCGEEGELAMVWREVRSHYRRTAAVVLVLTWLAAGVLWTMRERGPHADAWWLFALLGTGQSALFWQRAHMALLKGHLRYGPLLLAGCARTLAHGLVVWALYPAHLTLGSLIAAHLALQGLEQVALWRSAVRLVPGERDGQRLKPERRKEMRADAMKNVTLMVAQFFRDRIDTQLLASYVSLQAVSHYAVGVRLPNLFMDLCNALFGGHLLSGFAAAAARHEAAGLLERLLAALRLSGCVGLSAGLGLFLLGPAFLVRWLGPEFEAAGPVVCLLAPGVALAMMQYPAMSFLAGVNRHGLLAAGYVTLAALNLAASWWLVRRIGLTGVVWATTLDLALQALVLMPWLAARALPIDPLRYLWRTVLLPVAVFAATALPLAWGWTSLLDLSGYTGLATGAGGLAVVCAGVGWCLVLRSEDRAFVRGRLRAWLPRR